MFVLSRAFGPALVGAFAVSRTLLQAFGLFSTFGFKNISKKYIAIYYSSRDAESLAGISLLSIVSTAFVSCTFTGILFFNFHHVAKIANIEFLEPARFMILGIPGFALMKVGTAATQGYKESKYGVYSTDIVYSVGALLLVASGAYLLNSLLAAIAGYVFALSAAALLSIWFLFRLGAFEKAHTPNFNTKKWMGEAIPMFFISIGQYLLIWTDIAVLSLYVPSTQIGYYEIAYQTAVLLGFAVFAANSVFPSKASELHFNDQAEELGKYYSIISKWSTYLTILGFTFLYLYGEVLLGFFGPGYMVAWLPLVVLGASRCLWAVFGPAGQVLMMVDMERLEMINTFFAAFLNVMLNIILIPHYGIAGAAIASGISFAVINAVRLYEVIELAGVPLDFVEHIRGSPPVIATISVILILTYFLGVTIISAVSSLLIGTSVFLIGTYLYGFTDTDRLLFEEV